MIFGISTGFDVSEGVCDTLTHLHFDVSRGHFPFSTTFPAQPSLKKVGKRFFSLKNRLKIRIFSISAGFSALAGVCDTSTNLHLSFSEIIVHDVSLC
jgi:hypothetical protein